MRNLINVQLPRAFSIPSENKLWWIRLNKRNEIISFDSMPNNFSFEAEDWNGDWLSPRGVDLQVNGGLGLAFSELNLEDIPQLIKLLEKLWIDGVEAIAPTLVTCSPSAMRTALSVFHRVRKDVADNQCRLLGAHLEGPFLSNSYIGAHDHRHLQVPSLYALDDCIKGFEHEISLVTLAPELPGASDVITRLKGLGIIVSLGHSAADQKIAGYAFDQGVSMITHTFNAMAGLHHRAPGPIGEAISRGDIALGLIADGNHVDPKIAVILQQLATNNLFLVSDALPPYGLDVNHCFWGDRLLKIKEGVCRLDNGTLAGTVNPLLQGCRNLASWTNDPSSAIWSGTVSPRLILEKGKTFQDFLIDKPLKKLLRWSLNSQSKSLNWDQAA